jgi:hypothetical protein
MSSLLHSFKLIKIISTGPGNKEAMKNNVGRGSVPVWK